MDAHYEPYWHQAMDLRNKTANFIGGKDHPVAHALHQESSMLVEDIEMNRQPRAIEDRINGIQSRLSQARTMGDEIIAVTHNSDLRGHFEKMREGIRQLPHY